MASNGYEFELDMLIASKHWGCAVAEESIRTIYQADAQASHFDPLLDSMRVSFVLLRFSGLSLATAALDNLVFWSLYHAGAGVMQSQVGGRLAAVLFNYAAARRAVFLSHERHRKLLPRYLLLVAASGVASYQLIRLLRSALGLEVMWAKVLAETALFLVNFLLQRDFVFTRPGRPEATDWDRYHRSAPFAARLTRRYTTARLIGALRRVGARTIVELGGAGSCFLPPVLAGIRPGAYHVVDNNQYGLDQLRRRLDPAWNVQLHRQDVLHLHLDVEADTVFSVGLIEHFPPAQTRQVIRTHFALLAAGGHAILSFPTPTPLYRAARWLAEAAGLWRFQDERPLERSEVLDAVAGQAELVSERLLWPLVFTQRMMVFRKLPHDGHD
jgi:putative flippase GtrA